MEVNDTELVFLITALKRIKTSAPVPDFGRQGESGHVGQDDGDRRDGFENFVFDAKLRQVRRVTAHHRIQTCNGEPSNLNVALDGGTCHQ
jgi:hypothetical protein